MSVVTARGGRARGLDAARAVRRRPGARARRRGEADARRADLLPPARPRPRQARHGRGRARGRAGPGRGRAARTSRSWWRRASGGRRSTAASCRSRRPSTTSPSSGCAACASRPWTRLHLGRRGERRARHAARLVRRLLVRPRVPRPPRAWRRRSPSSSRRATSTSLPYLAKKELYNRTGDKRFLVRSPSLDDPAGAASGWPTCSRTAARNKAVYNMDYYFVGDEGSLSSYTDAVDFCLGEHTLASFRKWLREQYGSLEALNRDVGQRASRAGTRCVPLTTEEARREGRFAPWADHRTYMEVSFAQRLPDGARRRARGRPRGPHRALRHAGHDSLERLRLAPARRRDRRLPLLLGRQPVGHPPLVRQAGRADRLLDRLRAQRGGRAGTRSGRAALQGVLFPQLFWSHSIVNPDLTFSRSGRDLGAAFQALRFEGVGRLLMEAERLDDGVAVHYSMPSVHAAGILGLPRPRRAEDEADRELPREPRRLGEAARRPRPLASTSWRRRRSRTGALARPARASCCRYSTALSDREVAEIAALRRGRRPVVAGGRRGGPLRRARARGARPERSTRSSASRLRRRRAPRVEPRVGRCRAAERRGRSLGLRGCGPRRARGLRARACAPTAAARCCRSETPTSPSPTGSAAAAPST